MFGSEVTPSNALLLLSLAANLYTLWPALCRFRRYLSNALLPHRSASLYEKRRCWKLRVSMKVRLRIDIEER